MRNFRAFRIDEALLGMLLVQYSYLMFQVISMDYCFLVSNVHGFSYCIGFNNVSARSVVTISACYGHNLLSNIYRKYFESRVLNALGKSRNKQPVLKFRIEHNREDK